MSKLLQCPSLSDSIHPLLCLPFIYPHEHKRPQVGMDT